MAKLEANVKVEILDALSKLADEEQFERIVLSRRRGGPWRLIVTLSDGQTIFKSGKTIHDALSS